MVITIYRVVRNRHNGSSNQVGSTKTVWNESNNAGNDKGNSRQATDNIHSWNES